LILIITITTSILDPLIYSIPDLPIPCLRDPGMPAAGAGCL